MGSCYSPADNTKTDTVCGTRQNWRWSTIVEPLWGSCYCSLALTTDKEGLYAEHNTVEYGVQFWNLLRFSPAHTTGTWRLNVEQNTQWKMKNDPGISQGLCDCSPDYLTLLHFCLSNQQSWTYRILLTQCYIPVHSVDIRTKCVLYKS